MKTVTLASADDRDESTVTKTVVTESVSSAIRLTLTVPEAAETAIIPERTAITKTVDTNKALSETIFAPQKVMGYTEAAHYIKFLQ